MPKNLHTPFGVRRFFLFCNGQDLNLKKAQPVKKNSSGNCFLGRRCAGGYRTRSVGSPSKQDCAASRVLLPAPKTGCPLWGQPVFYVLQDLNLKKAAAVKKISPGDWFSGRRCAGGYQTRSVGSPSKQDCAASRVLSSAPNKRHTQEGVPLIFLQTGLEL